MPINISQSSTIEVTAVFFSSAGFVTVPTSAQITITYPVSNTATTTVTLGMTVNANNVFATTWGVGVSQLGIVNYSITGAGQASPTTGTWRVTQ